MQFLLKKSTNVEEGKENEAFRKLNAFRHRKTISCRRQATFHHVTNNIMRNGPILRNVQELLDVDLKQINV